MNQLKTNITRRQMQCEIIKKVKTDPKTLRDKFRVKAPVPFVLAVKYQYISLGFNIKHMANS